jgi:hypothetical protein
LTIDTDLGRCLAPSWLPGARAAIVVVAKGQSFDHHWLAALELETGSVHPLLEFTTGRWLVEHLYPQYLDTGHIVYVEDGAIKAVPFDAERLTLRGDPIVLSQRLTQSVMAYVAVSRAGSVAYNVQPGGGQGQSDVPVRHLLWIDHEGNTDTLQVDLPGRPMYGVLSPDGQALSVTVAGKEFRRCWTVDLDREILSPLTFGQNDHVGLWRPDGQSFAFSSDRDGPSNLYLRFLRNSAEPVRLTWSEHHQCPSCWTPDGRQLIYSEFRADAGGDIWIIDPSQPGEPRELVVTGDSETHGMVSPDGRWLAYTSRFTGRSEIYLDRFPDTGQPIQVSTAGGHSPLWSTDGGELYFLTFLAGEREIDEGVQAAMAVTVEPGSPVTIGSPRQMFTGVFVSGGSARPHWDIAPDGSRFLLVSHQRPAVSARDLRMVLDWSTRLE